MTDKAPKIIKAISEGSEYDAAERMAAAMLNELGGIDDGRELSVVTNALAIFLERKGWNSTFGQRVGLGASMVLRHRRGLGPLS